MATSTGAPCTAAVLFSVGLCASAARPLAARHLLPASCTLVSGIGEFAENSGAASERIFLEPAIRNRSTTLLNVITRSILASVRLRARVDGLPVPAGLSARTNHPRRDSSPLRADDVLIA